jgi:GNAT superfamily N-acetyltransferase
MTEWTGSRVAHAVADLERSSAFYGDLLALLPRGGFAGHDGYDGRFFALPGGGELELTTGPAGPVSPSDEDLLVLYVRDVEAVRAVGARLTAAGVPSVGAANPYWNHWGQTFVDPDGYRVVIATEPRPDAAPVHIDWHEGPHAELRSLFELAEDSVVQLDGYLDAGRVLVARRGAARIGHLQLVPTNRPGEIELKSMAVVADEQGAGIGRELVRTAMARSRAEGWARMVVSTAAADAGNLRFYQRVGFRMSSVERDAFTPATGYPDPIEIDGIPLLDRVWFAADL